MTILLTILKIIGIILLAVIGLVLFIILLFLFVPMCYKVKAIHNEDETNVEFTFNYLSARIRASFIKGEGLKYKAKFLFLTLKDSEKNDEYEGEETGDVMDLEPDEYPEIEDAPHIELENESPVQDSGVDEAINTNTQIEAAATGDTTATEGIDISSVSNVSGETADEDSSLEDEPDISQMSEKEYKKYLKKQKKEEKKRKKQKKKSGEESIEDDTEKADVFDKIEDTLDNLNEKYDKAMDKYDKAMIKYDHVQQFLDQPFVQNTFRRVLKIITRFFGTVKPKKSSGYIHYGLSSSASTGEILGKLGMFYPLYGSWLTIEPDFYNKVIEGNLEIKGRIYVFRFVFPIIRLLISRDFWRTYKLAKKI